MVGNSRIYVGEKMGRRIWEHWIGMELNNTMIQEKQLLQALSKFRVMGKNRSCSQRLNNKIQITYKSNQSQITTFFVWGGGDGGGGNTLNLQRYLVLDTNLIKIQHFPVNGKKKSSEMH